MVSINGVALRMIKHGLFIVVMRKNLCVIFPTKVFLALLRRPPYYSLRDYGIDGQIGLEDTVNEYVMSLCCVMDQLYRILRKDGLLFLNLGDTYYSGKG